MCVLCIKRLNINNYYYMYNYTNFDKNNFDKNNEVIFILGTH